MKFDCKQITNILLAKKKLRIVDLADRLGCSPSNVMNKRGRNNMRVDELLEIAEALNFDMKIVFVDKADGNELVFSKEIKAEG